MTVIFIALVALIVAYVLIFNPDIGQLIADLRETPAEGAARESDANRRYQEWCSAVDAERAKEIAADEAEWQAYCARMEARS